MSWVGGLGLVSLARIGAPGSATAGHSLPDADCRDSAFGRNGTGRSPGVAWRGTDRLRAGFSSAIGAARRTIGFDGMHPPAVMAKLAEIQLGIAGQHLQLAQALGQTTGDLVRSGDLATLALAARDGPPDAADALIRQALADPMHRAERFRQAARYYAPFVPGKAIAAYADAIAGNSRDGDSLIEIARLHRQAGNPAEASRYLERAWRLAPARRSQGRIWGECGDLMLADGNMDEAEHCYVQALGIAQNLTDGDTDERAVRVDLSICHHRLGNLGRVAGKPALARAHFEADLAIALLLAAHDPFSAEWQRDLYACHERLAGLETECGRGGPARKHLEQALIIKMRLAKDAPRNLVWQRELLNTHLALGDLERRARNGVQARFHFEWNLAIAQRLSQRDSRCAEWQRRVAVGHERLGLLHQELHDPVQAQVHFEQARAIRTGLANSDRRNAVWQRDLAALHNRFGELERSHGHLAQARDHFAQALAIMDRLSAECPPGATRPRDLAICEIQLGRCELAQGLADAGLARFRRAETILKSLVAQSLDHALDQALDQAMLSRTLAYVQAELAKAAPTVAARERALIAQTQSATPPP
jgi:tetratricopeptide (TPR) repeat protein